MRLGYNDVILILTRILTQKLMKTEADDDTNDDLLKDGCFTNKTSTNNNTNSNVEHANIKYMMTTYSQ